MRRQPRTFVFYHHERFGPFSIEDLRRGRTHFGGSVARLRLLFALARRGHKVWIAGNVLASECEGVRGVPASKLQELPLHDSDPAPVLVLNNPPSEEEWLEFLPHKPARLRVLIWAGNYFTQFWLEQLVNRAVDRIVCVSRNHRDAYRVHRGFERIEASYSGIDKDFLAPRKAAEEEIVLSMSVPRRTKGIDRLFAAWRLVRSRRPHARLQVSGSAAMHAPTAALGKTGILDADVEAEFPDFFSDPPRTLAAHGIELLGARDMPDAYASLARATLAVVNPSHQSTETYCRAAVEAQAAGVPVVGALNGALPEVVASGRTGLLYATDSAEALATAILSLLSDPGLLADLGSFGPAWAEWFANYDLIAPDWEAISERAESDEPAPADPRPLEDRLRKFGYGKLRSRLREAVPVQAREMIRRALDA
jgi:glycosyltransferase involved in cell wall biosynthesis